MSTMKNLFILAMIAIVFASCSTTGNGELIGVQNRPIWNPTDPYGMVFVPQGSFNMDPGIKMYLMHTLLNIKLFQLQHST